MSGRGNDNHMGTNNPREPFPLQITLTLRSPPNPIDVFPTSAAKIRCSTNGFRREPWKKKLSKDALYAYQHTYRRDPAKATFWLSVQPSMLTLIGTEGGEVDATPLGFSENNSRRDRPIVAKLGIGIYPLNYFTSFLKMSRPCLPWLLTYDLISKVMSSEIYVPYRFNAWNLWTSVFLLVIWTWIGVARWHPWFTLTLWPFRGQPRSSEVNDLWWRHKSFFGLVVPRGNLVRWFLIWHPFVIHMCRNRVIEVIQYPKEKLYFKDVLFLTPKMVRRGRKASHCILKTVRNVLVIKSRL